MGKITNCLPPFWGNLFLSYSIIVESVDSINRDERGFPLTYIFILYLKKKKNKKNNNN